MSTGGVDSMDLNMVVDTFLDVAVNNAYQIYHQSHWKSGDYRLDALGFRQAIVDAFYRLYRKSLPPRTLLKGCRSLRHPANNFKFDGISHWIANGSQRWRSLPGCKGTSAYYCKKYNVGLYAECFELYYCN